MTNNTDAKEMNQREDVLQKADECLQRLIDYLPKVKNAILADRQFETLGLWLSPFRGKAESNLTLEFNEVLKSEAPQRSAEAITEIYVRDGQSRKETLRCPGAIVVSKQTWQMLLELNRMKSACADAFHSLGDRSTKRKFSKKHPSLIQLQVTRLLDLVEPSDEFDSLRFFVFSDYNCTRKLAGNLKREWLEQLRTMKNDPSLSLNDLHAYHYDKNTFEWQIKKDILDIATIADNEILAERRIKALHIRAYVSKQKGEGRYITAATPIVVRADCARLEIINELSNQVGSDDTEIFESIPIVERKHLYRYKLEFRPNSLEDGKSQATVKSTKKVLETNI